MYQITGSLVGAKNVKKMSQTKENKNKYKYKVVKKEMDRGVNIKKAINQR